MARVVVDIASNEILQVEKTPDIGSTSMLNGKYVLPVPDGADFDITPTSYILPQDGGDVASDLAAALLAQYPMYSNIAYNFLLEDTDIADLDLAAVFDGTGPSEVTRVQVGRATGPAPVGQAPNSTALLPENNSFGAARPGILVTDTIDIGPATTGAGADEFLVWWYVWQQTTTEDVMSDFGGTSGLNTPSEKGYVEVTQEPSDLTVYISHDDGSNWTQCGRLQPTDLVTFDTDVRVAFRWEGSDKLYIGAYAVMF